MAGSRIAAFSPTTEKISLYLSRMELYCKANKVEADLQVATLLTHIGADIFAKLHDLLNPVAPEDKTFAELKNILKTHFEPKTVRVGERYNFRTRRQASGETIAEYELELRRLAKTCEFLGDRLQEELLDQIVLGLRDDRLRKQLMVEVDLTFDKAIKIIQATERVDQSTHVMQNSHGAVNFSTKPRTKSVEKRTVCYRCGGQHTAQTCKFREVTCHTCGKRGHIARVCRTGSKDKDKPHTKQWKKPTHKVTEEEEEEYLYHVGDPSKPPIIIDILLNDTPVKMELDTGATRTLMSEQTFKALWKEAPKLRKSSVKLRTYSGEPLKVLGSIPIAVKYREQQTECSLLVVKGSGPTLLGRDWLGTIKLDWNSLAVNSVNSGPTLTEVLEKHKPIFRNHLGKVKNIVASLHIDEDVKPVFYKPRQVPYTMRDKVNKELERLEKTDVIEPVQFSDWAAPIVSVMKPDGSVRVCGDYKVTVNKVAKMETYPLPRAEDLFAKVAGGKKFSKLDIRSAYQQIPLDDKSQECLTINTQKGLYRYKKLPFGVHSAPAIFQRTMEGLLSDIPDTAVYIDDILISGKTEQEHLQNLEKVLSTLEEEGFTLKEEKCEFLTDEVQYLGHIISAEGIRPAKAKTRAIRDAPAPNNVSQLRSFLGMVNYYGKFMSNLSTKLAPLYRLLKKKADWQWGPTETKTFEEVKKMLSEVPVLEHYDPGKPLTLATDASPYGVGAVLSHVMPDGTEKPIAYASRSLNEVEKRYSQIDKEALAIKFGVTRFHQYLFGREFKIVSDHKPLQYLLNEKKAVPAMASARLQRWALILSSYNYTISYRPGEKLANADGLSRLPLPENPKKTPILEELVLLLDTVRTTPITVKQIKQWTDRDPILSRVRTLCQKGWTETSEDNLSPYRERKNELSILDECVLWGNRLVIPTVGRQSVLELLHEGHPGMTKTKQIARQVVWWPGLDAEIERTVQSCENCQQNQKNPNKAPLHVWEWPSQPWRRIHIDHLGPIEGRTVLIMIDAHSKWIEAEIVRSTTSKETIRCLREMTARFGLPELIVSDNGPSFTSEEFKIFVEKNGIKHKTTAPYHPATNGLAERAVQVIKNGLRKNNGDFELRLQRTLYRYRTQPHATTGTSPAELVLKRKPRTHLDLMHPDLSTKVAENQEKQQRQKSQQKERTIEKGNYCFVRNYRPGNRWIPATVFECLGPRNFRCELRNGAIVKRHLDQIRLRPSDTTELDLPIFAPGTESQDVSTPLVPEENSEIRPEQDLRRSTPEENSEIRPEQDLRRSTRNRRPPDRFQS